jgi:hypothetical protein
MWLAAFHEAAGALEVTTGELSALLDQLSRAVAPDLTS